MGILVDMFFLLHFLDRGCLVNEGKDAGEGRIPRGSGLVRVGEVVMLSIMASRYDNGCHRTMIGRIRASGTRVLRTI